MSDLANEVDRALSAAGLLLVFAAALFDLTYHQVVRIVAEPLPTGLRARTRHRQKLKGCLATRCIPLAVLTGAIAYLFLPLMVDISRRTSFAPVRFDFSSTAFVLLGAMVLALCLWSLLLSVRVLGRMDQAAVVHSDEDGLGTGVTRTWKSESTEPTRG